MRPFKEIKSRFVPLNRANIDTDAIIPKQFLQTIKRTGFGKHLFNDWRYLDGDSTRENPDFVLNKPVYKDAKILLTGDNFGCGSSREHAPWALAQYGFKVIIAPSFADIFYNNAFNSGILPLRLSEGDIARLFDIARVRPTCMLDVNLEDQSVKVEDGPSLHFDIDPYRKKTLLEGLDKIGVTLKEAPEIEKYECQMPSFL